QNARQRRTDYELHYDVRIAIRSSAEIERRYTVRAHNVCRNPRFVQEHGDELLVFRQLGKHSLHCNKFLESRFSTQARGVDFSHTSRSNAEQKFVSAK